MITVTHCTTAPQAATARGIPAASMGRRRCCCGPGADAGARARQRPANLHCHVATGSALKLLPQPGSDLEAQSQAPQWPGGYTGAAVTVTVLLVDSGTESSSEPPEGRVQSEAPGPPIRKVALAGECIITPFRLVHRGRCDRDRATSRLGHRVQQ
jgi:hypothetical protein